MKTDKVEYSDQLIQQLLDWSIKRFSWLEINVDDFLYDVTHAIPFIQKDGNEYKWVHKSFMEYFASCFICYDNKESEKKYLEKMITSNNSMKYYNVLDFCYEMDTLGFRKYAILPYLENYIDRYDNFFSNNYFKQMDEYDVYTAKEIIAENENINILIMNPSTNSEVFASKWEFMKNTHGIRILNEQYPTKIEYDIVNEVISKILRNKSSELFQNVISNEIPVIQNEMDINFSDDITNLINSDKDIFSQVVSLVSGMVFHEKDIRLKYEECKRVVKDIKEENSIENENVFEL